MLSARRVSALEPTSIAPTEVVPVPESSVALAAVTVASSASVMLSLDVVTLPPMLTVPPPPWVSVPPNDQVPPMVNPAPLVTLTSPLAAVERAPRDTPLPVRVTSLRAVVPPAAPEKVMLPPVPASTTRLLPPSTVVLKATAAPAAVAPPSVASMVRVAPESVTGPARVTVPPPRGDVAVKGDGAGATADGEGDVAAGLVVAGGVKVVADLDAPVAGGGAVGVVVSGEGDLPAPGGDGVVEDDVVAGLHDDADAVVAHRDGGVDRDVDVSLKDDVGGGVLDGPAADDEVGRAAVGEVDDVRGVTGVGRVGVHLAVIRARSRLDRDAVGVEEERSDAAVGGPRIDLAGEGEVVLAADLDKPAVAALRAAGGPDLAVEPGDVVGPDDGGTRVALVRGAHVDARRGADERAIRILLGSAALEVAADEHRAAAGCAGGVDGRVGHTDLLTQNSDLPAPARGRGRVDLAGHMHLAGALPLDAHVLGLDAPRVTDRDRVHVAGAHPDASGGDAARVLHGGPGARLRSRGTLDLDKEVAGPLTDHHVLARGHDNRALRRDDLPGVRDARARERHKVRRERAVVRHLARQVREAVDATQEVRV
jgi:hypothetical protein